MTIYVDSACHCHVSNPNGDFRKVETDFFNGKCQEFIEGFCYEDKENQLSIYAWKPFAELDKAQREYERELVEAARILLGEV